MFIFFKFIQQKSSLFLQQKLATAQQIRIISHAKREDIIF